MEGIKRDPLATENRVNAEQGSWSRDVLVIGIGNILWADEGFGPRAASCFHKRFRDVPGVDVMDGGTLGNYLINEITSSRRILVFDCCDFKSEPGTFRVLSGDEVSLWRSTKISPHQTGLNDLLAMAEMMGSTPESLVVVGVQPEVLDDYGGSLSATCRARLADAMDAAAKVMADWGYQLEERTEEERAALPPLAWNELEMDAYEAGRPSDDDACRAGDERFMRRVAGHRENPFEDL